MLNRKKIEEYSERSAMLADDYKVRAREYKHDKEYRARIRSHVCKTCWYILKPKPRQYVRTLSKCEACNKSMSFKSTLVHKVCDECAAKHDLCCECGGLMNYVLPTL